MARIVLSSALTFAIEMGRDAGRVLVEHQKTWHAKADRGRQTWTDVYHFKTEADDASDALMRARIRAVYPDHNILSEEGSPLMQGSRYTWVNDGVDGTIGYWSGINDHYAVCSALCEDDMPIIGVVNAVGRDHGNGEFYHAAHDRGAFLNGQRIHVSNEEDVNRVLMGVDAGKRNRQSIIPLLERLDRDQGGVGCVMRHACASVPLVLVASGKMHAYLATALEPEDMAAAVIIIQEAGGVVTTRDGRPWKIGEPSILAANPVLHAKLLEMIEGL